MELDKRELERVVAEGIGKATSCAAPAAKAWKDDDAIQTTSDKKKFRITVEDIRGTCVACHRVGETFYMSDDKTPEGICLAAFSGLIPYINAMICNATFPWESAPGRIRLGCPDPDNTVVFLIEEV